MNVVEINRERTFTLDEAQAVLQIIYRITEKYSDQVHQLLDRLEKLGQDHQSLILEIENEVNSLIRTWQSKMQKLGAHPKGLWIADFDSGDGYFCWKYPEAQIGYWHSYQDGFSKRVSVKAKLPFLFPEVQQTEL